MPIARRTSLSLLIVFCLALGLVAMPVPAAYAQEDEPVPQSLFLGEYVFTELASGASQSYTVNLPEAATYLITAVDEEEAVAFDVVVTDANGETVYDDIFETIELALDPGVTTLEFIAVDAGRLEFVVLGQIGSMSSDVDAPGRLPVGGIYQEENVSNPRYGVLTVPTTSYPQQVLLYVEPGAEDAFFITATGDDIGMEFITTDEDDLLRFWTHGGEYLIEAEPTLRRSVLTLIPFLSGPPAPLPLDLPMDATLAAGTTEGAFALNLDTSFDELTLSLVSETEGLSITFVDRLYDGSIYESSFGEPELLLEDVRPGTYYVFVEADEPAAADIAYTLQAGGSAGQPLVTLENGVAAAGAFEEGEESRTYQFDVSQPGALVAVSVTADSEEADFDLEVGLPSADAIWSSYAFGPDEELLFVAPVAGTYFIDILSNGSLDNYAITATEGDLAPALAVGDFTWGSLPAQSANLYRLEITEPGQLLTVILVGSEGSDLDMSISSYNAAGETLAYLTGFNAGSSEIVSETQLEPGLYEVEINSDFSDVDSDYFVLVRLEDPATIAGQWATSATATTQYGDEDYSASQMTGAPDTPLGGDRPTAWAALEADSGEEVVELAYAHPVKPRAVEIYESYNPGAVVAIEAFDAAGDQWVLLWSGEAAPAEEAVRVFSPELTTVDFTTDALRITLDTAAVSGWNEIDAVGLVGRP